MTFDEFQALSEQNQIAAVYAAGTFVARRWQEVDEAVLLYQMPVGFFTEPAYNTTRNEVLYTESFRPEESEKQEDYAFQIVARA